MGHRVGPRIRVSLNRHEKPAIYMARKRMNFRRTAPVMDDISTGRANYASHDENREISTGVRLNQQVKLHTGERAERVLV